MQELTYRLQDFQDKVTLVRIPIDREHENY
jgi:hypothetical protein